MSTCRGGITNLAVNVPTLEYCWQSRQEAATERPRICSHCNHYVVNKERNTLPSELGDDLQHFLLTGAVCNLIMFSSIPQPII